ncbi:MAG: hypothetical protein Q8K28_16865 [Hoeflea sp.]|uniref:hypothetical protein n=1 Tax=Hoeflea sp. TaxID=1940281 RepID=UPI0027311ADF|nr:hypothetical protein [Hoeflea sp.]MDP2121571.1 hypothetical protein [Hoeflea sp.]
MTDLTYSPAYRPVRLRGLFDAEPLFAATGLLIGLSLAPTLVAMAVDPREFLGENVWLKPVKFQIALSLYLLTLAFFARWLPAGMTARLSYRIYSGAVVFAVIAELVWIGGAAMYGTASHFNVSDPFLESIYGLMGAFAVLLTSATLVQGIGIWRNPVTGLVPALHLSITLSLVLTFILTLIVAGSLASQSGHLIGTPVSGARVPVLGWSREVGDLRVAHFFATHALHILPVAAIVIGAVLPRRWAVPAVWASALLFTAFVAASFAGAMAGLPLLPDF